MDNATIVTTTPEPRRFNGGITAEEADKAFAEYLANRRG